MSHIISHLDTSVTQLVEMYASMTKLQVKVNISMVKYGSLREKKGLKKGFPGSTCVGVGF